MLVHARGHLDSSDPMPIEIASIDVSISASGESMLIRLPDVWLRHEAEKQSPRGVSCSFRVCCSILSVPPSPYSHFEILEHRPSREHSPEETIESLTVHSLGTPELAVDGRSENKPL